MTNKAQGSITIRRRPKDGNPGADAVRYWLVPSVTTVKRMPDNTMTPTTLTCQKYKQSGNSIPVQTSEGTMKYEICYSSGDKTGEKTYTSAITMTSGMAWVKFVFYINSVVVASETVTVIADGNGITGVKEYYAKSSSSTTAPSKWDESVPELDSTDKYLWNYESITYSSGAVVNTTPAVIGVFGKGIKSVTNYYLATSSSSGVKTTTSGWTTTVQSPTAAKRYLWNYEKIEYTDNTTDTIAPHIIGVYGEKGDDGIDGVGIRKVEEFYLASSSSTGVTVSTKGWSTDVPALSADNKYLWNYEKTTYTDNSTESTTPAVIGVYGNDGKGISSVTNYYLATSSSSGVKTTTGGWTTTVQSPTAAKRYLWNYEKIEYTTGNPTTTEPHIIGVYGEQGIQGPPGEGGDNGDDAISVVVVGDSIVFKKGGGLQEAQVRVSIFKGTEKISANGACSTLQKSDGTYGTGAITTGLIWNFKMATDDAKDFLYTFTYSGGYDILRDIPFVVTVGSAKYYGNIHVCTVSDGAQGIPGKAYQPIRCREWSEIEVGSPLTTGLGDSDQWTDVVYVKTTAVASGVRYWKCIKAFTKQSGHTPPSDSDTTSTNALVGYLKESDNFGMLATDILLANYSLVKNLGVETIEMRDAAGNVLFLAKGGTVTCNTGNFNNIHISGNSTFKGFVFKEKFKVTSHNYSSISKKILQGTIDGEDIYATLLDLEKTGNWIEVQSLPSSYNETYFAWLPTIRVGEAYTDDYRDYVRQFMGNEVTIYNSTQKTLGVDTGENSVSIGPDMACHFKMVISPEKMKSDGIYLERIKWEYSNPFQF